VLTAIYRDKEMSDKTRNGWCFYSIYDVVLLKDIVYFIINILLSNIKEKRISKSIFVFSKMDKIKDEDK
jgi:hypothetical protein